MVVVDTTLQADDLPGDLRPLLRRVGRRIPAGVGQGHDHEQHGRRWVRQRHEESGHTPPLVEEGGAGRAAQQFGTLGGGNHFASLDVDEDDHVWAVVHSGSRGTGHDLAQHHMGVARQAMDESDVELEDADPAWLVEGSDEFDAYLRDLRWAQAYALGNRSRMMDLLLDALATETGRADVEQDRFDCHHNYTVREEHHGQELWVTRKGAIRARPGDRGIIPGSMGTASYLVTGRGSTEAFDSAAHGAGRRMSRTRAREQLDLDTFEEQMAGRAWLSHRAEDLLDEAPDAYKDIDEVMAAQADLVDVDHELHAVLNFKGT
jgi:tRNA-splicing ligase RtcB